MAQKNKREDKIRKRPAIIFIMISLVLTLLLGKVIYISFNNKKENSLDLLRQESYDSREIPYRRGKIVDANSMVLASSIKSYRVIMDVRQLLINAGDPGDEEYDLYINSTLDALNKYFKIDKEDVLKLIKNDPKRAYSVLQDNVDEISKQAFEENMKFTRQDEEKIKSKYTDEEEINKKIKELKEKKADNKKYIKGVYLEPQYKRYYPFNSLAADVIGFENYENIGIRGIEEYYNSTLSGSNGRIYKYRDSSNNMAQKNIEPKDGNTVELCLDVKYQKILEKHIKKFNKEHANEARKGLGSKNTAAMLVDPNTGSIIAMASYPGFNLNKPHDLKKTGLYSKKQIKEMTTEEKGEALNEIWNNFCVSQTYEPGSTAKAEVLSYALDNGCINSGFHYNCTGLIDVGGHKIHCSRRIGHGMQNAEQSLMHSCNTAFMKIGFLMGTDNMAKCQKMFNFGSYTKIDLPGEPDTTYQLHSPENMGIVDLATNAFGQNFEVTMVQKAAAFSAVINGGYYYRPHVANRILDSDGNVVEEIKPVLVRQVISEDTSKTMRRYLFHTVDNQVEGTGRSAKIKGYKIGGKTGTAEKIPRDKKSYMVSFIGFTPVDKPKYVCYVIIDEPNVEMQANSKLAVLLWRDIMMDVLKADKK